MKQNLNSAPTLVKESEETQTPLTTSPSPRTAAPVQILLIEDSPLDAQIFQKILSRVAHPERYWLVHVKKMAKALKVLSRTHFDLVITDLMLPDSRGLESVQALIKTAPGVPLVVLTSNDDEMMGLQAVSLGAQDFLIKGGVDSRSLQRCLTYAIKRNEVRAKMESELKVIAYQADHDSLTGIPNRKMFEFALQETLAQAKRLSQTFGVLFLDLDGFKPINDTYGHAFGDSVLKTISDRAHQCLRESDTIARLGGDEFAIILRNLAELEDAGIVAKKILAAIVEPIQTAGHSVSISASIGIALYPVDSSEASDLLKAADTAMYDAKKAGKNQVCFFNPLINARIEESHEMHQLVLEAWKNSDFVVHYQPQFDLKTGNMIGMEALPRWKYRGVGLVSAADFIPMVEKAGLLNQMNEWVLKEACKALSELGSSVDSNFRVSLNLSNRQLRQAALTPVFKRVLRDAKIDPGRIHFEFQESAAFLDSDRNLSNLRDLRELGVKLTLDHFGTGASSLTYLKVLPVNEIKLDVTLIRSFTEQTDKGNLTAAIIHAAHCLGLKVCAEGVESADQLEALQFLGCDFAQGFLTGRPISLTRLRQNILESKYEGLDGDNE